MTIGIWPLAAYNRLQSDLRADSDDQIRLSAHQFGGANKGPARIVDDPILNDNVLSFTKTMLFQLRTKGQRNSCSSPGSTIGAENCYSRDLAGLLRTSNKRPS